MSKVNDNFKNIQESYLFSTIAKKVAEYQANNPDKKIILMPPVRPLWSNRRPAC